MAGAVVMVTALLAILASAPVEQSTEAHSSPSITLVWADPNGLLRQGFQSMAEEVVAIFDHAGVAVEWRERVGEVDTDAVLVVVHLTPVRSSDLGLRGHAMGAMPHLHRLGLNRVVYIFFDNVLRTLQLRYEKPRVPTARETMVLAQALARVAVHEIVHAIAPTAPHTETGLMKFQLTRNDLRDIHDLRLSVETRTALLASLPQIVSSRTNR